MENDQKVIFHFSLTLLGISLIASSSMLINSPSAPAPSCHQISQHCRESQLCTCVHATTQMADLFLWLLQTKRLAFGGKGWNMFHVTAISGVTNFKSNMIDVLLVCLSLCIINKKVS